MKQQAHPTRTTLPGIGTRYDLTTEGGKHVSVVVHTDGRRFLGFHDPEDDDSCSASVPLDPGEAAALSQLLLPSPTDALPTAIEIDLVTEQIPVTARSPVAARSATPRPAAEPELRSWRYSGARARSRRPPPTSASPPATPWSSSAPAKA